MSVVNLRTLRKQRARADKAQRAAGNAARHGQPKALREAERAEAERAARILDAHRREEAAPDDA